MHIGSTFYDQSELKNFGFKHLGKNVLIKRNVGMFFTENISIGNNVRIDDFTIIVASREEVVFKNNTNIASHCYIAGSEGFILEEFSTFAPGVKIFSGSDDYSGEKLTGATVPKEFMGGKHGRVYIGKHCILGAGTIVLPDIAIGEGCSIGALSLVTKDLSSWGIYVGIPVKKIKDRSKKLLELELRYKETINE